METFPSSRSWNIQTVADSEAAGCDAVRQWLREFNHAANPDFMARWVRPENEAQSLILLATADSVVVGGLFAETQFAWLRISIMAVDPAFRGKGIGSSLLEEAERIAKKRGCRHVYVDTMAYQAPTFYRSHGFQIAGEIPDWDSHGHAKYFLTKDLPDTPKGV